MCVCAIMTHSYSSLQCTSTTKYLSLPASLYTILAVSCITCSHHSSLIPETPVAPRVTEVRVLNSTALQISWIYPGVTSNLVSFLVEYRLDAGQEWMIGVQLSPHRSTMVILHHLRPFTSYRVRVAAVQRDQTPVYSNETSVKTLEDGE